MTLGRLYKSVFVAALVASAPVSAMAANMGAGMSGAMGAGSSGSTEPYFDKDKALQLGLKDMDGGHYRDAAEIFAHLLEIDGNQPLVLYELGQSQAHLGRLRYAEQDYKDLIAADPGPVPPARELALIEVRLGHPDKAAAQLQQLKDRLAKCAETCPDAQPLASAVAEVEAALSAAPQKGPAS